MPKLRTLKVWANPFAHVDHEGRPASVVALEPVGDGVTVFDDRRFVGATLKAKITKKAPRGSAQQNEQDTWFEYHDEPSTVPMTPYYVKAIRAGELVPADKETAKKAGVPFQEPAAVLAEARNHSVMYVADHIAHDDHDEDFVDELKKFAFGPMVEAVEKRKLEEKAKTEEKKTEEKKTEEKKDIKKSGEPNKGGA